jgi:mycothiol synthase
MNLLRPFQWDDLDRLVTLLAACEEVDKNGSVPTADGLRHQFATPGIHADRYVWVLPEDGGALAAMGVGIPLPGHDGDMVQVAVAVRPDLRAGGLQEELLRYIEARAAEYSAQTGKSLKLTASANASQANYVKLYEENGFRPVRWFLELERDLEQPIPEHAMPEGIQARTLELEGDVESLHFIIDDSFRDHWNPISFTVEQLAHWIRSPKFRPDLALLAFSESGEPAGACISAVRDEYNRLNNAREGYVNTLGVRRPFRGRGLARALLSRSLRLLKEEGLTTSVLDVDAESPTGATRLYESVGFTERKRSIVFHKELQVLGLYPTPNA